MDRTIYPHQGLGPLRFGMAPADVSPLLGPPRRSKPRFDGSTREFRDLTDPSLGYRDDRLRDIDCAATVPGVIFEDIDVFQIEPKLVIKRFYERNGGALIGPGSLLFINIGINTSGFHDGKRFFDLKRDTEDTRSINVFAPGAFDTLVAEFEPIDLSFN